MDCHAEDEANGVGGGLLEPAEKGSNARGRGVTGAKRNYGKIAKV